MAKGSVRKKGKKWYYRFYVEDASGNLVQKECVGTESKSETEKLLRQAMDDYEKKKFVAKAENLTVGQLLDVWAEEELKTGTLSNGTVENYLGTIRNIKKHPLAERKLKNVTSEHLQSFFDLLSFGGVHPDGKERKGYSKDYIHSFSAVMQQSFRFAVFPKQYITFNPMQYIKLRYQTDEVDLFSDEDMDGNIQPISREDYVPSVTLREILCFPFVSLSKASLPFSSLSLIFCHAVLYGKAIVFASAKGISPSILRLLNAQPFIIEFCLKKKSTA